VTLIETGRLVLRPIYRAVARIILDGGIPPGLSFARGYPSQFSLEMMESVVSTAAPGRFGPYFVIRRLDRVIIGEIGCRVDVACATGRVGYTIVESCWGQGYATEALRALLDRVLAAQGISRVVAETTKGNIASRRVMEKAGMSYCGQRTGDGHCGRVGFGEGESEDLVIYEALAHHTAGSLTR
jgi:[ribosomal protein S5]-alanine N-acetyltransferase